MHAPAVSSSTQSLNAWNPAAAGPENVRHASTRSGGTGTPGAAGSPRSYAQYRSSSIGDDCAARWMSRHGSLRAPARAWLTRHALAASCVTCRRRRVRYRNACVGSKSTYAAGSHWRFTKFSRHLTSTLSSVTPCRSNSGSEGGSHW